MDGHRCARFANFAFGGSILKYLKLLLFNIGNISLSLTNHQLYIQLIDLMKMQCFILLFCNYYLTVHELYNE